jgi:2-polyprenyl-6-methoxyphenol hydroxylase-like FAD-dependent oxidoreductase
MKSVSCDVLVVGAGPSGLATAMQLVHSGLEVVIIDSNKRSVLTSNAIGIQAGTLELLMSVFGKKLVDTLMKRGVKVKEAQFTFLNGKKAVINMGAIPSIYNYLFMLPQYETERVFGQWLKMKGVVVKRQHELVKFTMNSNGVVAKVKVRGKETLEFRAKYIVGCDGAHSTVRHILNIPFTGLTYEGRFVLADVAMNKEVDLKKVGGHMGKEGIALFFPLNGKKRVRLFLIPIGGSDIGKDDMKIAGLRQLFARYVPGSLKVVSSEWISVFRLHCRVAKKFAVERAFLVGDAAHIHTPVGAQGMNVGIHEALELGWLLRRVLRDGEGAEILHRYEKMRRPIALRVRLFTNIGFRLLTMRNGFFRNYLFPWLLGSSFFKKRMLRGVSEVADVRRLIRDMEM